MFLPNQYLCVHEHLGSHLPPTHTPITVLTGCQVPKRPLLGFLWEFGICIKDDVKCTRPLIGKEDIIFWFQVT